MKIKDKIIILTIVIISILGTTYKIFAGALSFSGNLEHGEPYYYSLGLDEGWITGEAYKGGDAATSGKKQADSGREAYGMESGGGGANIGGSAQWVGSKTFSGEYIVSNRSKYSPDGGIIWFEDVCDNIDVLCTMQGTGITGKSRFLEDEYASGDVYMTKNEEYESITTYCLEDAEQAIQNIAKMDIDEQMYVERYYTSSKYGGVARSATPAQAFILSEAVNITAAGELTPLQYAWWLATNSGSAPETELSRSAFDFEAYIAKVRSTKEKAREKYSKVFQGDALESKLKEIDDANQKNIEGTKFTGFYLDYDANFVKTEEDSLGYKTVFDEKDQKFIIGPFQLDYVEHKPFAAIENMEVYSNDGIIDKSEYKIAVPKNENAGNLPEEWIFLNTAEKEYPDDGQKFYIHLNFNEKYEYIDDIEVKFRYMNGAGSYTYYSGTRKQVLVKGHIIGHFDPELYRQVKEFAETIENGLNSDPKIIYVFGIASGGRPSDSIQRINSYALSRTTDSTSNFERTVTRQLQNSTIYTWVPDDDTGGSNFTIARPVEADFVTGYTTITTIDNPITSYFSMMSERGGENANEYIFNQYVYNHLSNVIDAWQTRLNNYYRNIALKNQGVAPYKDQSYDKIWDDTSPGEVEVADAEEYIKWARAQMRRYVSYELAVPSPMTFDIWRDLDFTNVTDMVAQAQSILGAGTKGEEGNETSVEGGSGAAARWWQYKTIYLQDYDDASGYIQIEKTVNGAPKENTKYKFELTVDGHEPELLTVKYKNGAWNTVESKEYSWKIIRDEKKRNSKEPLQGSSDRNNSAPNFTLKELSNNSGYSLESASGEGTYDASTKTFTGKLRDGAVPISIRIKNANDEGGDTLKLNINKIAKKTELEGNLNSNSYNMIGDNFYFDVTFSIKETGGEAVITYDGQTQELVYPNTITIKNVVTRAVGEDDPRNPANIVIAPEGSTTVNYEIAEKLTPEQEKNCTNFEYTNKTGELKRPNPDDKNPVTVTEVVANAINEYKLVRTPVNVSKTFDPAIADKFTEDSLKSFQFRFKVNAYTDQACTKKLVDPSGEEYAEKTILATFSINSDGTWCWAGGTEDYVYTAGSAPYFKIVEDPTWCPLCGQIPKNTTHECMLNLVLDQNLTNEALNAYNTAVGSPFSYIITGIETVHGNEQRYIIVQSSIDSITSGTALPENQIITEENGIDINVPGKLVYNVELAGKVINTWGDPGPHEGRIVITKNIASDDDEILSKLQENSYNFIVRVNATQDSIFAYDANNSGTIDANEWILDKDVVIQLTNSENPPVSVTKIFDPHNDIGAPGNFATGSTTEYDKDQYDKEHMVTIEIPAGGTSATWQSNKFFWYDSKSPSVSVEEDTTGIDLRTETNQTIEVNSSVSPKDGRLADGNQTTTSSGTKDFTYEVTALNSVKSHSGKLHIIKTFEAEGEDAISVADLEYIRNLNFKFRLTLDAPYGELPDIVLGRDATKDENKVYYDEENGVWKWEYFSDEFSWATDSELNYTLEEIELPEGIELEEMVSNSGNYDNSTKVLTGTILDSAGDTTDQENIEYICTDVEVHQGFPSSPNVGTISIRKVFENTKNILNKSQFIFDVYVTGSFEYNGQQYNNEKVNIAGETGVTVDAASGTWTSNEIHWRGNAPEYEVVERTSNVATKLIKENTKGFLTDGENSNVTAKFMNTGVTDDSVYLKIQKNVTQGESVNEDFTFRVKIGQKEGNDIKADDQIISIKAGETWTSEPITWEEGTPAPSYYVEEINLPAGSTFKEITTSHGTVEGMKATGTFSADNNADISQKAKPVSVTVVATNELERRHGNFKIIKEVINSKLIDKAKEQEFDVKVKLTGTFKFEGEPDSEYQKRTEEKTIKIKDTEVKTCSDVFGKLNVVWYGDNAPELSVDETVLTGWERPHYSNNGDLGVALSEEHDTVITITNKLDVQIELLMDLAGIVWEDEAQDPQGKNTAESAPNGIIDYVANDMAENGIDGVGVNVYRIILHNGQEVDRKILSDYNNKYASSLKFPIITENNGKWELRNIPVTGFSEDELAVVKRIDNTNEVDDKDKRAKYLSSHGWEVKYDVEFIYDGQTFEPTEELAFAKTSSDSNYNDVINSFMSKSASKIADLGNCDEARARYGKLTDTSAYTDLSSKNRTLVFGNSSYALDYNREEVDNRILEVKGKSAINGNGDTVGEVSGKMQVDDLGHVISTENGSVSSNEGDVAINYEAAVPSIGKTRVESKVVTTTESGIVYDVFKTKARTSTGSMVFPVDNKYSLEYIDTVYKVSGTVQRYKAVYEDCLHINLGLVKRPEVDIETTKDLYSAKVVINEKEIDYRFNSLADMISKLQENKYSRVETLDDSDKDISYELGLYGTDYFYRAEIYRQNEEIYNALGKYYQDKFSRNLEDSEIEVYLTYRIGVHNASDNNTYKVVINSIDDYAECSLGNIVGTEITKVINGNEEVVAVPSFKYVPAGNSDLKELPQYNASQKVDWNLSESNIRSSDGLTYNKFTANDLNITLNNSGESQYIFLTYNVKKTSMDEVKDCVALGEKSNIAEIANYTTRYNKDNSIAGKIDKDSAPSNVNIINYNEQNGWYEDDTYAAPGLKITLLNSYREVLGTAWEDRPTDEITGLGDGLRTDDESLIGGLTTELVEKITIDETDYDFIWPTNVKMLSLGGKTIKEVTGFSSFTETSRINDPEIHFNDKNNNGVEDDGETISLDVGQYLFTNVPVGNFVVRFLYGNDKLELEDKEEVSIESATAYNSTGTRIQALDNTSNYDNYIDGKSPKVYNGQDFKSTIYQAGFDNISNAWHDLENGSLLDADVSDARDSESERLYVIANSETITYDQSKVLATANDLSANHNDLYANYSMFADTAKLNLDIENQEASGKVLNGINRNEVDGRIFDGNSVEIDRNDTDYTIDNIDIGLIQRPETNVVLDKEIKEIKLITNDEKVIFDAIYDISYEIVAEADIAGRVVVSRFFNTTQNVNQYVVARVELNNASLNINELQSLDKQENKLVELDNPSVRSGIQNFRFINVDSEILQGTTIEISYLLTALNLGEVDYTSAILDDITERNTDSRIIKDEIRNLANVAKQHARESVDIATLGEYLGTSYYTGDHTNDVQVASKVRQVIDYVDNDAVFTAAYNETSDHMWKNTSINELLGYGQNENRLVSENVLPEFEVLDKNQISYINSQRNNIALSIDDQSEIAGDVVSSNIGFESKLLPLKALVDNPVNGALVDENCQSNITLTVTRTVSGQDDANNLAYDNLAEIVKFENIVGRRDITVVAGNSDPKAGEFEAAFDERDSSATELITFTPPTGQEVENTMKVQIMIVTLAGLSIVVTGIVVIKKKILK